MRRLQAPPPWFWGGPEGIWQRFGGAAPGRLPLELLQQLHWWLASPLRLWRRSAAAPRPWPWWITLRACWLNSYRPAEVAWWWAAGVRSWRQLARHTPDSLANARHAERRRPWPDQCRPALRLLSDKAALLACTPEHWRAPFLLLGAEGGSSMPHGAAPAWWEQALQGTGVVLKPQNGHAGRAVLRFRWTEGQLQQQALFRQLPSPAATWRGDRPPEPQQLLAHWQSLCRTEEAALAAPYLSHSAALPAAEPSAVVRVITARATAEAPVGIRAAWLEVPLAGGAVAILGPAGQLLPHPGAPLSEAAQNALTLWQQRLAAGPPGSIQACLDAAVNLHQQLPPIDQVAWDWVPAEPEPRLLEGNGGFGLLIPQLWEQACEAGAQP